jgi:hypothetical protein
VSSRDFRPRKGNRLFGTWPLNEDPPPGWQRSGTVLIWRVATGEPADDAVEVIGYSQTVNLGVSDV